MARSASGSSRTLLTIAVLTASIVACRAFVDLDGLGGGSGATTADADTNDAPETEEDASGDSEHPTQLDSSTIIDASDDIPQFDVDASKPCPSGSGPSMVRIPTTTGSFCIDSSEVTKSDYQTFLASGPDPTANQGAFCGWNASFIPSSGWPPTIADASKPVGGVDYCDAQAYCKWAGKRMCGRVGGGALSFAESTTPTSEWVFTCTGAGTRLYPYGNTYDANKCNGGETMPAPGLESAKARPTCEVSGVYDLAGNAHEWIDSCVVTATPETDPCVISSSSYDGHPMADMACTAMGTGSRNTSHSAITFRCCAD
jgi:formylglycine-generating enzyme